jgi:hypothetical protein
VYTSEGKNFELSLMSIKAKQFHATWFDPRTGKTTDAGTVSGVERQSFQPPSTGYGQDWVLIVDDASKNYKSPSFN